MCVCVIEGEVGGRVNCVVLKTREKESKTREREKGERERGFFYIENKRKRKENERELARVSESSIDKCNVT